MADQWDLTARVQQWWYLDPFTRNTDFGASCNSLFHYVNFCLCWYSLAGYVPQNIVKFSQILCTTIGCSSALVLRQRSLQFAGFDLGTFVLGATFLCSMASWQFSFIQLSLRWLVSLQYLYSRSGFRIHQHLVPAGTAWVFQGRVYWQTQTFGSCTTFTCQLWI